MYFKKKGSRDLLVLSFVWQLFDWHSFGGLFRSLVVYWTTLRTLNLFKTVLLWMFDVWSMMNCKNRGRKRSWFTHETSQSRQMCADRDLNTWPVRVRNRNATTTKQEWHDYETGMPQLRKQECHDYETGMPQLRKQECHNYENRNAAHSTGPFSFDSWAIMQACPSWHFCAKVM